MHEIDRSDGFGIGLSAQYRHRLTSQFPPPTVPPLNPDPLPKTNMCNSPFCTTVKNCCQSFFFARFPGASQYSLCHSKPSFAHGAPSRANSSSSSSSAVLAETSEEIEWVSSSCSRMTVWLRFDAKPIEAKADVYQRNSSLTHFVDRRCIAPSGTQATV